MLPDLFSPADGFDNRATATRFSRGTDILHSRPKSSTDFSPLLDLPPPIHLRRVVHFDELFGGTAVENAMVVGLDLTGSAARPSGYYVTRGRDAQTSVLVSDEAILDMVLTAEPDIVSSDSPLCLPLGRSRVTYDDSARAEAGIMRISERILKRRGINAYPCLLPTMQRLTERGIRLAGAIRKHGIPVIECYPEAAQDIMGILRKGAGEEWLKLGMSEFGVTGRFISEKITHDELDAITCSLVGFSTLPVARRRSVAKAKNP